ncbi:hypothetical protein ACA910_005051 [Epithemia clementina (nom. ined.)]
MGRCNNRRTQQAAEDMKNTAARARFSKRPPVKNSSSGGRSGGRDQQQGRGRGGGRWDPNYVVSGGGGGGGGGGGQTSGAIPTSMVHSQVVAKMAQRVEEQQQQQAKSNGASALNITGTQQDPLRNVDISKLDEIQLSEEAITAIAHILGQLNVVESDKQGLNQQVENDKTPNNDDTPADVLNKYSSATDVPAFDEKIEGGGYVEYEDDFDDSSQVEAENQPEKPPNLNPSEQQYNQNGNSKQEKDPVYLHLTQALSFSRADALKACRAIDSWGFSKTGGRTTTGGTNSEKRPKDHASRMTVAMDWLCLHLTEKELDLCFRPNQLTASAEAAPKGTEYPGLPSRVVKYKAIPHASISVATKLTDDLEWQRKNRLERRVLDFIKLGFQYKDALKACGQVPPSNDDLPALQDWQTLTILLETLEQAMLSTKKQDMPDVVENVDGRNDEDARMEQEQEIEALSGIYEGHVEVSETCTLQKEKCVKITLDAATVASSCQTAGEHKNNEPNDNVLYILMRLGYPVKTTPLILFFNPHMPPPLLLRINGELMKHASDIFVHQSLIFDMVAHVNENLSAIQLAFQDEQSLLELNAAAWEGGGGGNTDDETDDLDDVRLGRRRKARLKGDEKAHDYGETIQRNEIERKKRQTERVAMAKTEQANLRITLADRAIRDRETQRYQEELKKNCRAAFSAALNRGESAKDAQLAAARAEDEFIKEHGVISGGLDAKNKTIDSDTKIKTCDFDKISRPTETEDGALVINSEESLNETDNGQKEKPSNSMRTIEATPVTKAFMDRLRGMYNAAQKRGPFDLRQPATGNSDSQMLSDDDDDDMTVPCPIPTRAGDFTSIMDDVLELQNKQPWLVSDEARAPLKHEHTTNDQDDQRQPPSDVELSKKIKIARDRASSSQQFEDIMSQRKNLPAYNKRDEITAAIREHQVVVISGETGSGKTTQVPQFVLDDLISRDCGAYANILVTQPRRISAIGVAERMAKERCEKCGQTVGYSIKLEKKMSGNTRLLLCTTGILLRRLIGDPDLASVSHVFVDEVHLRDIQTDFILIILKGLLKRRRKLKVILMSATLNAEAFSAYFGGAAIVAIPGRTHPVQEFRLEDILQEITEHDIFEEFTVKNKEEFNESHLSKSALRKLYYPKYSSKVIHSLSIVDEQRINYTLLVQLLEHICQTKEEGAILVFMPGLAEITKAIDEMRKKEFFQSPAVLILPLHANLSSTDQTAVFNVPPSGIRKIIVATNIAETSITVEDVVYVVDSGRVKENQRDELNNTPMLVESWVSRAAAKQRRGRAGRVRPGTAYHMFSSHIHDKVLKDHHQPEMQRVGLEDLILLVLILDLGDPARVLGKALDHPSASAVVHSLKLLEELGAIDCTWGDDGNLVKRQIDDEDCSSLAVKTELTPLGFHLAALPVEPRVGKMLLYGAMFGCVEEALTIAAAMSSKNPFIATFDQRAAADEAKRELAINGSDFLAVLVAFTGWKRSRGNREVSFLKEHSLSRMTLHQINDLRKQYASLLIDIGFVPRNYNLNQRDSRQHSQLDDSNIAMLVGVLCAGLYPNIIVAPQGLVSDSGSWGAGDYPFRSPKGDVFLHPSTALFPAKQLEGRYCCYHSIVKTSKLYVRDCTIVSPLSLLLFGGTLQVFQKQEVATVDGWLKFRISRKSATSIKYVRQEMESILLRRIVSPEDDSARERDTVAMMQCIRVILQKKQGYTTNAKRIMQPNVSYRGRNQREVRGRKGRGRDSS